MRLHCASMKVLCVPFWKLGGMLKLVVLGLWFGMDIVHVMLCVVIFNVVTTSAAVILIVEERFLLWLLVSSMSVAIVAISQWCTGCVEGKRTGWHCLLLSSVIAIVLAVVAGDWRYSFMLSCCNECY